MHRTLKRDFAELFSVSDEDFPRAAVEWRDRHLSVAARARLAVVREAVAGAGGTGAVHVRFPDGSTRRMAPVESSEITKLVITEFAPRHLERPAVIWVSETKEEVVSRGVRLTCDVRLDIAAERLLPDIILVDVGPERPLFVFVEVVASDGPITSERLEALAELVVSGGHDP